MKNKIVFISTTRLLLFNSSDSEKTSQPLPYLEVEPLPRQPQDARSYVQLLSVAHSSPAARVEQLRILPPHTLRAIIIHKLLAG